MNHRAIIKDKSLVDEIGRTINTSTLNNYNRRGLINKIANASLYINDFCIPFSAPNRVDLDRKDLCKAVSDEKRQPRTSWLTVQSHSTKYASQVELKINVATTNLYTAQHKTLELFSMYLNGSNYFQKS